MNEKSGSHWDAAHAASWDKWFHIIEDGAQGLSERMVERAAVAPGSQVLDIATGLGEPAVTAAAFGGGEAAAPSWGRCVATALRGAILGLLAWAGYLLALGP